MSSIGFFVRNIPLDGHDALLIYILIITLVLSVVIANYRKLKREEFYAESEDLKKNYKTVLFTHIISITLLSLFDIFLAIEAFI